MKSRVLENLHQGHPGIANAKAIARNLVWWPSIDSQIEEYCKSCHNCAQVVGKPNRNLKYSWPKPNKKWDRVHLDHFFFEQQAFLLAMDPLTKYIECELVRSVNGSDTVEALSMMFSRQGLPSVIVTDNATSFCCSDMTTFLKINNIKHITSPPRHPESNSMGEAGVKVIKGLLRKNTAGSLKIRLATSLLYYRCTPVDGINSPSELLNSRKLMTVKERMNPFYCTSDIQGSGMVKSLPEYEIGQTCLALSFSGNPKWQKAIICQRLGINTYLVKFVNSNVTCKRHIDQLQNKVIRDDIFSDGTAQLESIVNSESVVQGNVSNDSNTVGTGRSDISKEIVHNDVHDNNDASIVNSEPIGRNNMDAFNDVRDESASIPVPEIQNNIPPMPRRSNRLRKPPQRFSPD
jgi:hypothetical protein